MQLNNPAAVRPTDTNSVAIASEAAKARYKAMDAMYALAREDLRAVMLAQAYYFDQTEDPTIPISSFLVRSATQTFREVSAALMPFASKQQAVSMVFDRSNTAIREQLQAQPRGWFNAIAANDTVYVSPTIVRASLVACAGRVAFTPSIVHRLRDEDLVRLRERHITPADVRPSTRAAQQQVAGLTSCIADQLTFLIAHELAHTLLAMNSEEGADCIGAAVAQSLRKAGPGIFDALIFRTVGTDDEDLLGADKDALAQLSCRRKAPYILNTAAIVDLKTAVATCQAIVRDCG
ncbi:hypothetical protein [Aquabacterium sp.]|uniref:hypothetical protein n=1 Tax=Aquabacterium sp. TaxID=1872578 RepID=UPI0040377605